MLEDYQPRTGFFRRAAREHIRYAHSRAIPLASAALAEASGARFFQAGLWRLRALQVGREHPQYGTYSQLARGSASAMRAGWIGSGMALAGTVYASVLNPMGPLVGAGSALGFSVAAAAGLRLGWGYGAALGTHGGRFWSGVTPIAGRLGRLLSRTSSYQTSLGRSMWQAGGRIAARRWYTIGGMFRLAGGGLWTTGQATRVTGVVLRGFSGAMRLIGRLPVGPGMTLGKAILSGATAATTIALGVAGSFLAGIVAPALAEIGFQYASHTGFRISRRGFGNLYGPHRDTPWAITMRQQALAAISQSQLNARSALGSEAALLHFN